MLWKFGNKEPQNVVNNIKVEIDYDKLANKITQSILNANKKIEEENQKSSRILTSGIAVSIMVLFFVLAAFSLTGMCFLMKHIITTNWDSIDSGILQKIFCVAFCVVLFFIAIILFISGIEIYREKDRNFIMSAFSGIVGFIALIAALVAIIIEVM